MDAETNQNIRVLVDSTGRRLSRREVLRLAAGFGLSMPVIAGLLAACGGDDDDGAAGENGDGGEYFFAFANVLESGELFVQFGDGVIEAAEVAGVRVKRYNNNLDAETTLSNARLMVQDQPDLILEYNGVEGIGESLRQIFDDANIPFIAINVPIPGGHWFNLVNREIGADTARVVVPIAQEMGWTAADTTVLIVQGSTAGVEVNDCVRYFYVTAAEMMGMEEVAPESITAETTRISDTGLQVDGLATLEESYTAVNNALQTIPEDRHILLYTINDDSTIGAWRAVTEAQRDANTLVAGLGGSVAALQELRNNPQWVAEGSIFTTNWGQYLIAMGIAVMEDMEIPELTKSPQVILTKETVDTYYDADGHVKLLPPLVPENEYLAETGVLQKFNNIEGLESS
ncbi:MAG TPA: substrate-binding domain-containing protein [Thermomicrobiales bacterium]|nr:substrate-binding domain-containing protein [Thermomicrobiales bacterium]